MKTELNRIQQMLAASWNGQMWHGTNLTEVLKDIDADKAFRKPPVGGHNIYELVMHLYCWRYFVLQHLKGDADYKVILNSDMDWPMQYEVSQDNWHKALQLLEQTQHELIDALAAFDEKLLDESMHGRKFSWYDLIHGLIHHDIYHSAQISILKK